MIAHVYVVEPGNTLSGISRSFGVSLAAVEAANPQIRNDDLIFVGQDVTIPGAYSQSEAVSQSQAPVTSPSPSSASYVPTGGLSDVPGVPSSFAACVAYRESTDLQNPAAHGNAYGIIPASGYVVAGDSLAQQKQVFREIYDSAGPRAWQADGCPGT